MIGKGLCWTAVGIVCVAAMVGAFGLIMSGYGQKLQDEQRIPRY